MIDFGKITSDELRELKQIVSKAAEKSELEKSYLFSYTTVEKAKIFIFCHRFLGNVYNMLDDGDLKTSIGDTIDETKSIYNGILYLLERNKSTTFHKFRRERIIFEYVNNKVVDDIIDLFSVLTEKVNVIQISKLKGILLEGRSGVEYKKVFKKPEV